MTTHYLYATILTGEAVAANNRGDNLGNTTTLQKVFHQDDVHTSISAEAIRFALRYRFQLAGLRVNRHYDGERLSYEDEKRTYWGSSQQPFTPFIDDDLMGFMDAAAARAERDEEEAEPGSTAKSGKKKGKKKKGTITKRTSPLAVGRAVSLRPYRGELSFNCVSGVKEKGKLSLYNAEMHTTEYQYSIALNLNDVRDKQNIGHLIDALIDPPPVAGNHARFYYDFSPASIVFRVTSAHASRIQNCFEHDEERRTYTVARLIQRVESGDIPAKELVIGGGLSHTNEGKKLKGLGVTVLAGVCKAADEVKQRIAQRDKVFEKVFAVPAEGR
jgi:CRISPR-associated protein Cst2